MKKHKISIILGAAALLLNGVAVSANESDCKVIPDFSSNTLVIEGNAESKEQVTVMVFPDGTTPENYWGKIPAGNIKETIATGADTSFKTLVADPANIVSFADDFYADEDGTFSYTIGLKETGVYDIYLLYSDSGKTGTVEDIQFTVLGDYSKKIAELNKMDKKAFTEALKNEETQKLLGFVDEINEEVSIEDVAGVIFESKGNSGLSDDFNDNLMLYKASAAIVALNDGKDVDSEYFEYCLEDETIKYYFENYAHSDAFKDNLKNKDMEKVSDLLYNVKEGLILAVVKNPNGYENIKSIFKDFKDITEISSPTSNNKVYSELSGRDFDSLEELLEAYEEEMDKISEGSGGGNGGSSSSGSKKNPSYSVQPSVGVNETASTINKNIFDDLDNVAWAQEAIVTLAANGVINGKSDKIFAPNDYVTREEFTKLVVAALAEDAEPAHISFSDVQSGRWSYSYVAKAKGAGLINGYSDTYFGATDLITRQDMSVIIYNAAKYKEIKLLDASNSSAFADDGKIADYAKTAIYTLKEMEIVNGTDAMHFEPTAFATRAQAAVMLYRLLLK